MLQYAVIFLVISLVAGTIISGRLLSGPHPATGSTLFAH